MKKVEDRIGGNLMEGIIGEDIGLIIEIIITAIEDMDMVEVVLGEVILEEVMLAEIYITMVEEWIGHGKIGECGGSLGQGKEIEIVEVDHHLVLGWGQGLVQTEIGSGVLNAESMTILQMNALMWSPITQIGTVTMQGLSHYIWQIVIQDRM